MNKKGITQLNEQQAVLRKLGFGKKVRITQLKGLVRTLPVHRANMEALGLHGIGKSVEHVLTPSIAGMVKSVIHLVKIEEV